MGFNLFGPTYSVLSKVLDLRAQRQTLIASNIANAETPRYKSKQLKFEEELKNFAPSSGRLKLKKTDPKHIPFKPDINNINPEIVLEDTPPIRADGNNVDLDKEFVKMSKNQLMYNTVAQILGKKFKGLISAIKEVR